VLIDEVLDSIDEDTRARALDIFATDLKDTAVIHIGRAQARDPIFSRVLHLIKDPTLHRLVRHKATSLGGKTPAKRAAMNS
jgi:ABC-type uncharacterized transport system fused permease/ATPase subunit